MVVEIVAFKVTVPLPYRGFSRVFDIWYRLIRIFGLVTLMVYEPMFSVELDPFLGINVMVTPMVTVTLPVYGAENWYEIPASRDVLVSVEMFTPLMFATVAPYEPPVAKVTVTPHPSGTPQNHAPQISSSPIVIQFLMQVDVFPDSLGVFVPRVLSPSGHLTRMMDIVALVPVG